MLFLERLAAASVSSALFRGELDLDRQRRRTRIGHEVQPCDGAGVAKIALCQPDELDERRWAGHDASRNLPAHRALRLGLGSPERDEHLRDGLDELGACRLARRRGERRARRPGRAMDRSVLPPRPCLLAAVGEKRSEQTQHRRQAQSECLPR